METKINNKPMTIAWKHPKAGEKLSATVITCGLLTLRASLGGGCVGTAEEERAEEEREADEENAFVSAVF